MLFVSAYFFVLSCAYIILIYKFLVIYSLFDFVFCVKIRQCDYCLDNFVCSFMVAPYIGIIWLEFLLRKLLSVKVLIYKDNFGYVSGFLVRWEFDFWVVKWVKCLILVVFDDMGYDKGFWWVEFGILIDFSWEFEICGEVKIWSWYVDESAMWISKKQATVSVFATPYTFKRSVILHFSVYW